MKVELTWNEYCLMVVKDEIERRGNISLREFARRTKIHVALISKVLNGKYTPNYNTLCKWFPNRDIRKPKMIVNLEI